ncbi:AGE family epimerase/isomerase [Patescibacteria group bacterium]|nr:AGE family epimerase/isomerase [Patescibacteria group bacterium]
MDVKNFSQLESFYRSQLLDNVVPFWLRYSLDKEFGGYLILLDQDGSIYGTDKYMWSQGRETWLFAKLYNTVEKREEWLQAAKIGADFIKKYAFDWNERVYFRVSREGKPIYKPWSIFSEVFVIIGLAQFAKASGDEEALNLSLQTFWNVISWLKNPKILGTHIYVDNCPIKTHALPMIMIATAQELREVAKDERFDEIINQNLNEILYVHAKDKLEALLETVGKNGEIIDSPEGRCVNPGHAIESVWFCLREAIKKDDKKITERALRILDWSLKQGWDKKYGGILYFVDVKGKPPEQLEWDMKLWWPHTEALYALLLAYQVSGEKKYLNWYERVHTYTFKHFPDPTFGEWFGYLHREGTVSLKFKGSMWKGPFHLPRALLNCMQLLEKVNEKPGERKVF